jgi:serine/threonine protein kinase
MTGSTLLAGRYEVGETLGEGGSPRVYRAHDPPFRAARWRSRRCTPTCRPQTGSVSVQNL